MLLLCRPPRGGRGLKSYIGSGWITGNASPPSRGAWIEILVVVLPHISPIGVAPLAGGVD